MLRLIEIGWACGGVLALCVVLLARNRVISSVKENNHIKAPQKKLRAPATAPGPYPLFALKCPKA
jgi:hypothetical protein